MLNKIKTLNSRINLILSSVDYDQFSTFSSADSRKEFIQLVRSYFSWTLVDDFSIIESIEFYFRDQSEPILLNTVTPTVKNPFSPDDRYYRMGMRSCTSLAWMNYTESDKTVDAVRILYHPNTYIAYGYCLVRVNENYFASYSNVQFDNEQYILILDETNTVISSNSMDFRGKSFYDVTGAEFRFSYNNEVIDTIEDGEYYYNTIDMRSGQKYPNWRVVVITEFQDIFGDLYLTQSRTTLLSSCLIVIWPGGGFYDYANQ